MYLSASILLLVVVFLLVSSIIDLMAAISRKSGTVYPWTFGLYVAYIVGYFAFIY